MSREAFIVTDIGFGDAGKGTTVDYLVRQGKSSVVVRHNGGPQAAHNVLTSDGRHHTFAQFGSGSFVPGVRTHLSHFMQVNPLNMVCEADKLRTVGVTDAWDLLTVDGECPVITPWQIGATRLRELARGSGRHGSCGQGIGETQSDLLTMPDLVIRVKQLTRPRELAASLRRLRDAKYDQLRQGLKTPATKQAAQEWTAFTDDSLIDWLCEEYANWGQLATIVNSTHLAELAENHDRLVFEGAQGVLLDEWFGFHPYTTWSTTTPANALNLLSEIEFDGELTRLGVLRAFATRHGPGPFVTETPGLSSFLDEPHNVTGEWQGVFRHGYLDEVALCYALEVCGETDGMIVTHLDALPKVPEWKICVGYELTKHAADAEIFFNLGPTGQIRRIFPGVRGNLDYQGRLTELLSSCRPVYETIDAPSADEYLSRIEHGLGLPIFAASFGPTAADKRLQHALV